MLVKSKKKNKKELIWVKVCIEPPAAATACFVGEVDLSSGVDT